MKFRGGYQGSEYCSWEKSGWVFSLFWAPFHLVLTHPSERSFPWLMYLHTGVNGQGCSWLLVVTWEFWWPQTPPTIHRKSWGESVSQTTCVPLVAHCSAGAYHEKLNSNHLSLGGETFLPPLLGCYVLKDRNPRHSILTLVLTALTTSDALSICYVPRTVLSPSYG